MADEYYAEPTLADVLMQENALANGGPSQWSWEFQKPLLMDWLRRSMMLAPLALPGRSARGAAIGNDAVMANKLWQQSLEAPHLGGRQYFGVGDITGGAPSANPSRYGNHATYAESSAGIARDPRFDRPLSVDGVEVWMPREGMRPAAVPDQMRRL